MKKRTIISTISIFILCFITHNLYKWFPNTIFSIFFPVNESIWEHMKMLYTTILLWGIIDYFFIKDAKVITSSFISSVISIPIYLIMFLPWHSSNMILIFSLLFITILLSQIVSTWILKHEIKPIINIISTIAIIMVYIIMGILTYHPPHTSLFLDNMDLKYGINIYIIKILAPSY